MKTLRILHLADDRPGHYHLAEGVIAAAERLGPVEVERLLIRRRRIVPTRMLRYLTGQHWFPPGAVLAAGYGIAAQSLAPARLVVSAGGETLAANAAAARALGAANIFCGSLRGIAAENFSLVVSSYDRHAQLPRHIVTLKPSKLDPDALGRPAQVPRLGAASPPRLAGLLIGGDSGLFRYRMEEWRRLFDFAKAVSAAWGTRWIVSTSPRTARDPADAAAALARDPAVVAEFIDYRVAGPGTLAGLFAQVDCIVCTEDSSTMISEAISARLPVVGVSPADHAFSAEERKYRSFLAGRNWCRYMPIEALSVEAFGAALSEITVFEGNPLDDLAATLRRRLPSLFAPRD